MDLCPELKPQREEARPQRHQWEALTSQHQTTDEDDRYHLQELYDQIDLDPRPGQPTIPAARARTYILPAGINH